MWSESQSDHLMAPSLGDSPKGLQGRLSSSHAFVSPDGRLATGRPLFEDKSRENLEKEIFGQIKRYRAELKGAWVEIDHLARIREKLAALRWSERSRVAPCQPIGVDHLSE
jgi:hypothetical protein